MLGSLMISHHNYRQGYGYADLAPDQHHVDAARVKSAATALIQASITWKSLVGISVSSDLAKKIERVAIEIIASCESGLSVNQNETEDLYDFLKGYFVRFKKQSQRYFASDWRFEVAYSNVENYFESLSFAIFGYLPVLEQQEIFEAS